MKCLDIIIWKPQRKHAKDRRPTNPVIGVTNYDRCRKVYYLIVELDYKNIDIPKLVKSENLCMLVETTKGYHLYFNICSENPLKIIHQGIKIGFDRGQLKMGLMRYRVTGDKRHGYLVLRVSPKYEKPDLRVVFFNSECPEWFHQVKRAIELLNK